MPASFDEIEIGQAVSLGAAGVDAAALDAHCRDSSLPNYKRPREYVFVQAST